ncbi:MAG: TlyA family RNA methyltransferase [Clostridia bacterium]|nr:TlyA family RNA methyltransferase [Clostridia bacterium]
MNSRLDVELVNKGLVESREKAKALIMAGAVYIDGQKAYKAGDKVKEGQMIEVKGEVLPFVSRGGLKLDKSVKCFNLSLEGLVCADIGASTGGFTDCMLQNGASKVYSIDVGYGQLAWKLRNDPRVVNMERTNIRYIDFNLITDPVSFISIDVSFISLKLVLPVAYKMLSEGGNLVCLIKPQFEAGREEVGKKGVVRDIAIHRKVISATVTAASEIGFRVEALDYSPIKGPEGNIEFLLHLSKNGQGEILVDDSRIDYVTSQAHLM